MGGETCLTKRQLNEINNSKKYIENIINICNFKNGKLLSNNIKKTRAIISIECEFGHIWEATYASIIKGTWCPSCANCKKLTLEDAVNIAKDHGGKLKSTEYKNNHSKLIWECKLGHEFEKDIKTIKEGNWCPYCSYWTSEEICRIYFESIFEMKFNKIKPKWLTNNDGNQMELDGYSQSPFNGFHIAFEHNGMQHYSNENIFYKRSKELFKKRLDDDNTKINKCKENNVLLIIIPQLFKLTKLQDLVNLIKKECIKNNINITIKNNKINIEHIYYDNIKINEILNIIEPYGGKLLSKNYINADCKLDFSCKNGHLFKLRPRLVKQGQWCKYCFIDIYKENFKKEAIQKCIEFANKNKLIVNIDTIDNLRSKIEWNCIVCKSIMFCSYPAIRHRESACINCKKIKLKAKI